MNKLLKGGMIMLGLMAGCSPQETTAAPAAPVAVAKKVGSSVKSSVKALETFVTDRIAVK